MTIMPLDTGLKNAFRQIENGTAFNRSFENVVGTVEGHINSIQTRVNSLPTQINGVADSIVGKARNIESQVTSAATRIPQFANHVKGQFDNIMNNVSTFASSQGLKNALAGKSGGCSNMGDFFGSITTRGPQLISQVTQLVDEVKTEIDRFQNLGTTLQGNITATKDEIINQLNAEIGSVVNDAQRLTNLNALKATVEAQFHSGIAEARAQLTQQVQSAISQQRAALVDQVSRQMRSMDLDIQGAANRIQGAVGNIDARTTSLQSLISGETSALQGAVRELETLGAASGMRSLQNSNPCVQTLMGFVGHDSFLRNLGGHG